MSSPEHIRRVRLLYKTIQKLHRGLPEELKNLGKNYTRDEFKRHKTCNPAESSVFMHEWTNYAITLAKQLGLQGPKTGTHQFGQHLEEEALEKLRDDQVAQLYELMLAATGQTSDANEKKQN